jgi:hypothetical protein
MERLEELGKFKKKSVTSSGFKPATVWLNVGLGTEHNTFKPCLEQKQH